MKTLKKIKLSELGKFETELKKEEMKNLKGASGSCACVCYGSGVYADSTRPYSSSNNSAS